MKKNFTGFGVVTPPTERETPESLPDGHPRPGSGDRKPTDCTRHDSAARAAPLIHFIHDIPSLCSFLLTALIVQSRRPGAPVAHDHHSRPAVDGQRTADAVRKCTAGDAGHRQIDDADGVSAAVCASPEAQVPKATFDDFRSGRVT